MGWWAIYFVLQCGWCLFNRAIDVPDPRGVLAWRKSRPGGNAFLIRFVPDFQTPSVLVRRLGVMWIEVDFLPMAKPFSNEPIEVPPRSGVPFFRGAAVCLVVFTQGHDLGPSATGRIASRDCENGALGAFQTSVRPSTGRARLQECLARRGFV